MTKKIFLITTALLLFLAICLEAQTPDDYPRPERKRLVEADGIAYIAAQIDGENVILAKGKTKVSTLAKALWKDADLKKTWSSEYKWTDKTFVQHFLEMNDLPGDVELNEGHILRLKHKDNVGKVSSHVKLRNQSLWEISQIRNVKYQNLLKMNGILLESELKDGDVVLLRSTRLPDVPFENIKTDIVYAPEKDAYIIREKLEEERQNVNAQIEEQIKESGNTSAVKPQTKASIKAGEQYEAFATKFGMTLERLYALNPGINQERVAARFEEELVVETGTKNNGNTPSNSNNGSKTAKIAAGEPYADFAKKHNLTVEQLFSLNSQINHSETFAFKEADLVIAGEFKSKVETLPSTDGTISASDVKTEVYRDNTVVNNSVTSTNNTTATGEELREIIQSGENVSFLCKRVNQKYPGLGLDLNEFRALNPNIKNIDRVFPGTEVIVGYKLADGSYTPVKPQGFVASNNTTSTNPASNGTATSVGSTTSSISNYQPKEGQKVEPNGDILAFCERNEKYSDFAKRVGVDEKEIKAMNGIPDNITVNASPTWWKIGSTSGSNLIASTHTGAVSSPVTTDPTISGTSTSASTAASSGSPTNPKWPAGAFAQGSYIYMTINAGESYKDFAKRALITEEELRKLNEAVIMPEHFSAPSSVVLHIGFIGEYPPAGTTNSDGTLAIPAEGYHVVKENDMISKIAKMYGLRKDEVLGWNGITDATPLKIGQKIWLRQQSALDNPVNIEIKDFERYEYYEVQKGDMLSNIAKKFGVSVQEIKLMNDLKSDNIVPEQILLVRKLKVPPSNAYGAGIHVVQSGETMTQIASKYNIWLHDLQDWNGLPYYITRVASGTKIYVTKQIMPDNVDFDLFDAYLVQKGDNVSSIAANYNIKQSTLRKLNGWEDSFEKIHEGQLIKVPRPLPPAPKPIIHTVLPGETLSEISAAYRVSMSDVMKWNNLKSTNLKIQPYQELLISEEEYNKRVEARQILNVTVPDNLKGMRYTVRPGDTIFSISRMYGLSVDELKARNNKRSDEIYPGEVLVIFEDK
jgi:LysM repeat protein